MNKDEFQILDVYPFDNSVFTQGLEVNENVLFVSSGEYGKSFVSKINLNNGMLYDKIKIDDKYFAEGLTIIDNSLLLATWKENRLLVLNKERYITTEINELTFKGEVWGLTNANNLIYMSDGSNRIYHFNMSNPNKNDYITVTLDNKPLSLINDIEYADDYIYANVWYSDNIYKIDIKTGKVVKTYNLENLGNRFNIKELKSSELGVLNGIAHISKNLFYVTGKNWPVILKIKLE